MTKDDYRERLPNVFLAGAPKCGSTFVSSLMSKHPEIFVPHSKEPAFYSNDPKHGFFDRGFSFYMKNYAESSKEQVLVDASTIYFSDPDSANLVKEYVKCPRVIIILRNPVDRVYSNYWQYVKSGFDLPDIVSMMKSRSQLLSHMMHVSNYGLHVQRHLSSFLEGSVKCLLYEDLRDNPIETLRDIYRFLDLPPFEHNDKEIKEIKNPPGIPRNRVLARLLRQKKSIQFFKAMLPPSAIPPFRNFLMKMRSINTLKRPYEPLDLELRKMLWQDLSNVPEDVERLTGLDVTIWKSDRDQFI